MTMGMGDKRVSVEALRKLLPLWLRVSGYVIDDSRIAAAGMLTVDCSTLGKGRKEVEAFIGRLLRAMTVSDGGVWYKFDDRTSIMWIKVDNDV